MAKHHKNNRLTREQRKEIALLANAGIRRTLLARDYKVSIHTIHAISKQRRKWIDEEQIATKKEQAFPYAQRIYLQMNPGPRKYIFNRVYEPVIRRIQERLVGRSQERLFFKAVLGSKSVPNIDKRALAKYRARIRRHALVLIHDVRKRVIYDNLRQAVLGMGYLIVALEEASVRPRERTTRDRLRKTIDEVLKTLTSRERTIVKLRYGIEDGYIHVLKELGRVFQITDERVRQIESEAIGKLRHPETISKLKKLIDSPSVRNCVQRPLAKRSYGFRHP